MQSKMIISATIEGMKPHEERIIQNSLKYYKIVSRLDTVPERAHEKHSVGRESAIVFIIEEPS
jgi:hypothetical protein